MQQYKQQWGWRNTLYFDHACCMTGVGKVRPAGQIRSVSSVHPARGGSAVLTLNSARKTYRTMSDCFHAERDLVAH